MLYKFAKTKVVKERSKTVALKYSPFDRDARGLEIGNNN